MKQYLFITNVYKVKTTHLLKNLLSHYFKLNDISFEIKDNKSLLHIKAENLSPVRIKSTVQEFGYKCEEVI